MLNHSNQSVWREGPTSAYVHIPFCRRRCYYCDFPISVVGDANGWQSHRQTGSNSGAIASPKPGIAEYVEVLCQEIKITPVLNKSLQTVFLVVVRLPSYR